MKKALIISVVLAVVFALAIISLVYYYIVPYKPFEDLSADDVYGIWTGHSGFPSDIRYRLAIDKEEAFAAYLRDIELKRVPQNLPTVGLEGGFCVFLMEMENGKTVEVGIVTQWCVQIDGKYYIARKPLPHSELGMLEDAAREEGVQKILEWYSNGG